MPEGAATPSDACPDLIKRREKLRLTPYPCPSGKPTIAYGHTRNVRLTDPPCTVEQAEAWLREDIDEAARLVNLRVKVPLTQGMMDALCSFVFNIGGERFKEPQCTLLRWLNAGLPKEQVAGQFDRWVYGRDQKTGRTFKLPGLVSRRAEEKALFLS